MSTKQVVLFLASDPGDVQKLHLDAEIHSITKRIREGDYRDSLELISRWAVTPDDLLLELNAVKPTIVHFSGHGTEAGELILTNDLLQAEAEGPDALKALFSALKDNIRLVVLNACYSEREGRAIADVIDCVVGMNASIGDEAAITFAAAFYGAIGFGRSVKEAFEQGKVALMLHHIPEENTPQLLARQGVDPASIFLVGVEPNHEAENPVLGKAKSLIGKVLPKDKAIPLLDKLRRLQDSEKERVLLLVRLENGQSFEAAVDYFMMGIYFFVHPITKAVNQPRPEDIKEIQVVSVAD